jgi:thiol-disulfide isomerase/thioredoxin
MDRVLVGVGLVALISLAAVVIRAREAEGPERVDLADVGLPGTDGVAVVAFSTPYCVPCQAWESALDGSGMEFLKVDLSERPELARRYRISATPLVLAVRVSDGQVLQTYSGAPNGGEVERLRLLATA